MNTHFVILSVVEGRFTTFQQYYVCRPIFFQRLLPRTAIGVGSLHNLHTIISSVKGRLLFLSNFSVRRSLFPESRLPAKKRRESFIFSPPLHAHIRYVSLRAYAQLSRLWWLFDCRNPASSLLIHSAIIPLPLNFSSIPCGAWGCLIAYFHKNNPNHIITPLE